MSYPHNQPPHEFRPLQQPMVQGSFEQPGGGFGAHEGRVVDQDLIPTMRINMQHLGHVVLAEAIPGITDSLGNPLNVYGNQVIMRNYRGTKPNGMPIYENVMVTPDPDQAAIIARYRRPVTTFGPQGSQVQAPATEERYTTRIERAHFDDEEVLEPWRQQTRRPASPPVKPAAAETSQPNTPTEESNPVPAVAGAAAAAEAARQTAIEDDEDVKPILGYQNPASTAGPVRWSEISPEHRRKNTLHD